MGVTLRTTSDPRIAAPFVGRWDLAFLGVLAYLLVEYARLGVRFSILGGLHIGKVVVVITAVGYLVSRFGRDTQSEIRSIDIALLGFLLASTISAWFSPFQEVAWAGLYISFLWAVNYFLISRIVNNAWRFRIFVFLFLLLNLKLAQFSIRSYFGEVASGRSEKFLSLWGAGAGTGGYFGNAGDFGVAMCVVWPLAAYLLLGETRMYLRILFLVCSVAFLGAIFFSGSRGALLGAAATVSVAWIRNPKRLGGALMVGLLAFGVVFVLPQANMDRLRRGFDWENDATAETRVALWKLGLHMFNEHPITGVGPGGFRAASYAYPEARIGPVTRRVHTPHSIYIQGLAELGVLGGLALLMLLVSFLRLNALTRKQILSAGSGGQNSFEYRLAFALDLSMVGYLVSGAFLTVLYYPHFWNLLALSTALRTVCFRKLHRKSAPKPHDPTRRFALAGSWSR